MTLFQLQNILGNLVLEVIDGDKTVTERERALENATTVQSLAKQMVNNGDLIVRAYKLAQDGKVPTEQIMSMIEGENENK